jgi:hypothetical protein
MELTVVESTNIYAMERLQANLAVHGTAFLRITKPREKGRGVKHGRRARFQHCNVCDHGLFLPFLNKTVSL